MFAMELAYSLGNFCAGRSELLLIRSRLCRI